MIYLVLLLVLSGCLLIIGDGNEVQVDENPELSIIHTEIEDDDSNEQE